ncbi:YciI family protein [Pelagibacterium lacus]|uniref:YciI family protein n=1 Tax=Pelagibacterium lacus TaxID=2282655 RepID=A0A369W545_9HYPH|nr:YciI family protein [Pelagibacterium lacus]RDE09463.1 YciI family protein [Pelagibacterium lacus]
MRFMVMIKASPDSEADIDPEEGLLLKMGQYNEELVKAGIMIDGAGLMSSAKGARVTVDNGKAMVTDGPFSEIKEVIAGFWIWNCASLEEAIAWVAKCPIAHGQNRFEIRQMHELEDFGTEGEGYEQHKKVEAQLAAQKGT